MSAKTNFSLNMRLLLGVTNGVPFGAAQLTNCCTRKAQLLHIRM